MAKARKPPSKKQTPQRSDADRRVRQADRLADHLRLLQLLVGRGRWDAKSLAEELECTERTVYRYLKVLEFAGVPYVFDKQQRCYSVLPSVKFPVLNLNPRELLSQAASASISKVQGICAGAGSLTTTEKIAATSSDETAELLKDAQRVMVALDLKLADHSKHHSMLQILQWALIEQKQVEAKYFSPHRQRVRDLTLHPWRLCLTGQAWYLIARPASEPSPKTYRVVRFKSVRMIDAPAEVPEEFDLHTYFGNAWTVFRGERSYAVEIEFTSDAAELVTETVWHKTQELKRHRDGRATLTFTVDGLDEIVWWVLGWSGRAKVVKPDELRQMVVNRLRQALEMNSALP